MVESSIDNPNSPAALLHKLCCRLLGKETDSKGMIQRINKPTCSFESNIYAIKFYKLNLYLVIFPNADKSPEISQHFQYALRVVGR